MGWLNVIDAGNYTPRNNIEEQLGNNMSVLQFISVQNISEVKMKSVKVLCWVNTYHKTHARAASIKATWGKRCDKLLFMSDIEDLQVPSVRIVAPPTHDHLWQKHRQVVAILYREFGDKYDWIFKCDDDTYLIMENLKHYLLSPAIATNAKSPMLVGHRMTLQWWLMQDAFGDIHAMQRDRRYFLLNTLQETKDQGGLYYTPGGGGYAFNAAYLKLLVESLDEPFCLPDEIVPDDWAISFCMRYHGVTPLDTR